MAVYLCHEHPDLYEHDAVVVDAAPGRVVLDRSALHPGGGGQVSDVGWLEHAGGTVAIVAIETVDDVVWHLLDDDAELTGRGRRARRRRPPVAGRPVAHRLARPQRARLRPLPRHARHRRADQRRRHRADGLRPLRGRQRRAARPRRRRQRRHRAAASTCAASTSTPATQPTSAGLVRSLSVAPPPTPDGQLRIIEIDGVDRQACGGTHLSNTAQSGPFRITKVESKGKRNRRIRFVLESGETRVGLLRLRLDDGRRRTGRRRRRGRRSPRSPRGSTPAPRRRRRRRRRRPCRCPC